MEGSLELAAETCLSVKKKHSEAFHSPKMRGPAEEKAVSIETEEVAEWNRIFQSNAGDRLTYFYLNVFNYIRLFTSSVISLFFLQFCTRSIFWSK